jgi:hypothetical protein
MVKAREKMVRVIRDSRDAKADYELSASRAQELYQNGKLWYDRTNDCYCHDRNDPTQCKFN